MKTISLFAAASVAATLVHANGIESITVTAERTPVSTDRATVPIEIIDEADIARRLARTPEDLLRGANGVTLSRSGGIGALTELRMRGAEANHVLVLVDGVEVNDAATGSNVDFSQVSLAGVERIEVLRGAQSALWGSDAIAGVIYFDTTPAVDSRHREISASTGSHDTRIVDAHLAANDGTFHYDLAGRHTTSDGTNVARSGTEQDGYRSDTFHANTGYRGEDWSIQAIARRTSATIDYDPAPFPDFVPADGDLFSRIDHALARVDLRFATQSTWQHRLTADLFDTRNRSFDEGAETNESDADKLRFGYTSSVTFDTGALSQVVTAAVEYERERFRQRGVPSPFGDPNQNQHIDNRALIAQWNGNLHNGIGLSLSARHDDNSAFRDATSHRAAIRAPLTASTVVFASYGTGHKNPTFTERFGFTPDTFLGNPDIAPERSTGYSLTVEQQIVAHVRAGLTWFDDRLRDEIDGFVFDPDRGAFTARNDSATSHRKGVELTIRAEFEKFGIAADYTYLDATEDDAGATVRELRRARHSARAWLDAKVGSNASIQIGGTYIGARHDLDFGQFPAPRVTLDDYVLLHLAARARISANFSAFARADNLIDENYEDVFGYATPGRTFEVGLIAEF